MAGTHWRKHQVVVAGVTLVAACTLLAVSPSTWISALSDRGVPHARGLASHHKEDDMEIKNDYNGNSDDSNKGGASYDNSGVKNSNDKSNGDDKSYSDDNSNGDDSRGGESYNGDESRHERHERKEKHERHERERHEQDEKHRQKKAHGYGKDEFGETWTETEVDCKRRCNKRSSTALSQHKKAHVKKCEKKCEDEKYWIQPGECVDRERVSLDWTNEQCVTAEMFLNQTTPEFFVMCGTEATLMKVEQFKPIDKVVNTLISLMYMSAICALIPMMLSSLFFQSLAGPPKKAGYGALADAEATAGQGGEESGQTGQGAYGAQATPADEGFCTKLKKQVGTFGYYAFLLALVAFNLYTTGMTTRRAWSETMEFRSTLHYGGWCNFALYLDYTCHGEILEVLTLAMFTWSDFLFIIGKLFHDCGIATGALCCSQWQAIKCFCCCRWLVFCNCKFFLQFLSILVCALPIVIVLGCVLVIPTIYSFLCMFLVAGVYSIVALAGIFVALCFVYVLSLIPMSIMKCAKGYPIQTPSEYFAHSYERLEHEIKNTNDQTHVKGFIMSKKWCILVPIAAFYSAEILDGLSSMLMGNLALSEGKYAEVIDLQSRIASPPIIQALIGIACTICAAANQFVYQYLVLIPLQAVPIYHEMLAYLDPQVALQAMASLADLGTKFDQFRNAVFLLRVGGGLMVGPLRLFQALAELDTVT
jgi:hypothetical protein